MAGIVCGINGAQGQSGNYYVAGTLTVNVPYQNTAGNTTAAVSNNPGQIGTATATQVYYSSANPTTGVTAAGTNPTGFYPYVRCVTAGGLVNTGTVVDVVFPNGEKDTQSLYCVVYTIAGGLLT